MPTLTSRPEESSFNLKQLDLHELELIACYVSLTRLGKGSIYRTAAYDLLTKLGNLLGDDFIEEAVELVNLEVSVTDKLGNPIDRHSYENITLEV